MGIILNSIFFSALSFYLAFQSPNTEEVARKKIILDHDNSSIQIIGSTNINEFTCVFAGEILTDTLEVILTQRDKKVIATGAILKLPVQNFICENTQMTSDFQQLLKAKLHPYIEIQLLSFYQHNNTHKVEASIRLAGEKNNYHVLTHVIKDENTYKCLGQPEICIKDFGLSAPEKFFGLVKVNENIFVQFNLSFRVIEA